MQTYVVRKIMQYTELVTVQADSRSEAEAKAMEIDGDRNHDDTVHDLEIVSVREAEEEDLE
jgi:hypothetical protein